MIEGLEALGFDVEYDPDFKAADLDAILPDLTGVIINTKIKMTADRISSAANLEFIGRLGSGLDIIDLPAAKEHNVAVYNSPEGNRNAVAEHALGMLLCLANNIRRGDADVRQKMWNRESRRGFELDGKTIGLVGFGNTGQAFARKLSSWTLDLIYSDPYLLEKPVDISTFKSTGIDQLQNDADIISFHVQLTEETRQMANEAFFKRCKPGVFIINTSRGDIVDTRALIEALESGHVAGACLDVFQNEKPHTFSEEEHHLFDRLYAMDNVILTPHVAGWTHESLYKISQVLVDKISRHSRV